MEKELPDRIPIYTRNDRSTTKGAEQGKDIEKQCGRRQKARSEIGHRCTESEASFAQWDLILESHKDICLSIQNLNI